MPAHFVAHRFLQPGCRNIAALLGILLALIAAPAAFGQDKIFYNIPGKGPQDVLIAVGQIVQESKDKVVIRNGGNREIPSNQIVEVYYQFPANAAAANQKAETLVQQAAQSTSDAKRKDLLGQAIKQFQAIQGQVKASKFIQRHIQFKIASISAQRATGDRELTLDAIDLLERFQKDHPDSWQHHHAARLLAMLKPN